MANMILKKHFAYAQPFLVTGVSSFFLSLCLIFPDSVLNQDARWCKLHKRHNLTSVSEWITIDLIIMYVVHLYFGKER